jgi:hypothetical protein
MSKHLGSLIRLQHKLASAYGDNDALANQFRSEIESRESVLTHARSHSVSRSLPSAARTLNCRQNVLCTSVR